MHMSHTRSQHLYKYPSFDQSSAKMFHLHSSLSDYAIPRCAMLMITCSSFPKSQFVQLHDASCISFRKLDENSLSVMYVSSWSICSQLLFHFLYEQQNTYRDDLKNSNSSAIWSSISSPKLSFHQGKKNISLYGAAFCYGFEIF